MNAITHGEVRKEIGFRGTVLFIATRFFNGKFEMEQFRNELNARNWAGL